MRIRGYQIDLARGGRNDVGYLSDVIRRLAGYGYNTVMLYLEYRFRYPSHPGLGMPDSLTPEQASELVKVAEAHDIDLVPQYNCAGHNEGTCSLEAYNYLCGGHPPVDGRGPYESLNPLRDDVLPFLRDIYTDLARVFPGPWLHVGGDEIRQMHAFMPDSSEQERMKAAFDFLGQVFELVRELGRTPMMWGDMMVKAPYTLQWVPKDVIIFDWRYSVPSKRDSLRRFRDAGYRVVMCPGTSTWHNYPAAILPENGPSEGGLAQYPDGALANTGLVREAREEKAEGFLLTTWENNKGACHECGWPVIAACAAVADGEDDEADRVLSRYSADAWGVESGDFADYLRLLQCRVLHIFPPGDGKGRHVFFRLRNGIFRSANVLPLLWREVNGPFRRDLRERARPVVQEAVELAGSLVARATRRQAEAELWHGYARLGRTMLDMGDHMDSLAAGYHEAAISQYRSEVAFQAAVIRVVDSMRALQEDLESFAAFGKRLIERHNQGHDENWWVERAEKDVAERLTAFRNSVHQGYSLLAFERFISDVPGSPTRILWR